MLQPDNVSKSKIALAHLLAASFVGAIAAAAAIHYQRRKLKSKNGKNSIAPRIGRTESGRAGNLERFSHYVARQFGFKDPVNECPQLCKLAYDYLRKAKGCEEDVYAYFANEAEADSLYVKLIEEFDRCILSYFAFHWNQVPLMISQVMDDESEKKPRFKNFVMAATRKQRFARISKDLKVTRVFSTLVEEMKVIGNGKVESDERQDLMVPVAHSQRSPLLLLMGGGMGAGKSTVTKDILKESFWQGAAANAVVVEADAFKESDVLYRALSSKGHHDDMLQTAELVHQSSTDAASSLLVTALNEGRDVIMDGTLSWEPFVEQTIAMARNVHKRRYRMGVGYKVAEDGTVTENYWEAVEEEIEEQVKTRKPYRVEIVGVVCDAYLAVVRGIRRAIMTGRAVRVHSQLNSHKRFAAAFPRYCKLVDNARLYCTNALGGPPKLIAWKEGDNNLLTDREEFECLTNVANLNAEAQCIHELYNEPSPTNDPSSVWNQIVLSTARPSIQSQIKAAIQKIETPSS